MPRGFREDLFHRLNVIRVYIPPLRERREEIPALIHYFLNFYQQEIAKSEIKLAEEVVDLMVVYDWPGNVRQLSNEIRRIVTYGDSGSIVTADFVARDRSHKPGPGIMLPGGGTKANRTFSGLGNAQDDPVSGSQRTRQTDDQRGAGALSRKGLYLKMDRLSFND